MKLTRQNGDYNTFCKDNDLATQYDRLRLADYNRKSEKDAIKAFKRSSANSSGTNLVSTDANPKLSSVISNKAKIEDVTQEYIKKATPEMGVIKYEKEYNKAHHSAEIEVANLVHSKLGGDITLLSESNADGVKTPDYLWNDKGWELKSITSAKAADSATRKALKQISKNPGGIILDMGENEIPLESLIGITDRRIYRGCDFDIDVMILAKSEIIGILRYKK